MNLDILFTAWNRLEFTKRSFGFLLEHTHWDRVDRLVVYDDGSTPQAQLWLQDACRESPRPVVFRSRRWRSPVAIMCDYLHEGPADYFVKIDNDVAVPPGWLDALLSVAERYPTIDLLGFEAGMTILPVQKPSSLSIPAGWDGRYGVQRSSHIGGVGLMRSEVFSRGKLRAAGRYYGFTEWQHMNRGIARGWITPDLAAPLMDRIPAEPFLTLSEEYREAGWQRDWPTYPEDWLDWAYGWVLEREAACVTD